MLKHQRHKQILELLQQQQLVTINDLSQRLDVSYMTIWRDLKEMEDAGLVQRFRGGASIFPSGEDQASGALPGQDGDDPTYIRKDRLGRYAAQHLVADGDNLTIEAGSTASSLIPYLTQSNLTILTNGLYTSLLAAPLVRNLTLICSGGILIDTGAFTGPQAEDFFSKFRVKKAFFGASGLTLEDGFTDPTPLYTRLKQAMKQNTDQVVMLIDSSKLGVRSLVQVMPLQDVQVVVTNADADPQLVAGLRARGIDVHLVE